jgi:hypothetical protein
MSLQGRPNWGLALHFTMATTIQRALGVVHAAPRLYVAVQVAALQPVNENLGLVDVSPQRGCFRPDGRRPAVGAGDILTVEPRQLVRHLVQLIAQRADQLHGLGDIDFNHAGMVARSPLPVGETAQAVTIPSTKRAVTEIVQRLIDAGRRSPRRRT